MSEIQDAELKEIKRILARKIGCAPDEMAPAVLNLLYNQDKRSPYKQQNEQLLLDSTQGLRADGIPMPVATLDDLEQFALQVARGMQYVASAEKKPLGIEEVQFFGGKLNPNQKLKPAFQYKISEKALGIPAWMVSVYAYDKKNNIRKTMPLHRSKEFTTDEYMFLVGVEEAYHSIQCTVPEIKEKLDSQAESRKILPLPPTPDVIERDIGYWRHPYEHDAAEYRKKVCEKLGLGIPHKKQILSQQGPMWGGSGFSL